MLIEDNVTYITEIICSYRVFDIHICKSFFLFVFLNYTDTWYKCSIIYFKYNKNAFQQKLRKRWCTILLYKRTGKAISIYFLKGDYDVIKLAKEKKYIFKIKIECFSPKEKHTEASTYVKVE